MADGIIQLTGTITVPEDRLDTFRAALAVHACLSRQDPGCLVFEVTPDENDPCLYRVFEQFEDRFCFEAHKKRAMTSDWWQITKDLDRAYEEQLIEPNE